MNNYKTMNYTDYFICRNFNMTPRFRIITKSLQNHDICVTLLKMAYT